MMPSYKFDYKKLRSEIFLRYNIELDETSLSILHILLVETKAELLKNTRSINEATEKINDNTTSLQVDCQHPRWQAFWFGMGNLGFSIIFSVTLLFMLGFIYTIQKKENAQVNKEWLWYKTYYELTQTHKATAVKEFLKNNPAPKEK